LLAEGLDETLLQRLREFPLVTLKPTVLVDESDTDYNSMFFKVYYSLGMIFFFTAGPTESRAWSAKKSITAYEAAGKIHSDIQRGFIKAEMVKMKDLVEYGHMNELKSRGLFHLKDKDYIIEDGDMITFRFNV